MTTKKAKSMGRCVFYGVRDVGSRRPNAYWAPALKYVRAYKKREETILDNWELVRVTVEPVKKGKK